jgi:hypothetical protein
MVLTIDEPVYNSFSQGKIILDFLSNLWYTLNRKEIEMGKAEIKVLSDEKQENYVILDEQGARHKGTVVVKPINCGKHCRGCPHKSYKYICWKQKSKTRWKYIGVVKKEKNSL